MSYRGFGGYRAGDYYVPVRRRRRAAGDIFDAGSIDTSAFDPSSIDAGGGTDTSLGTPDFSDVTGGSSSVSTDPSLLGQPGGIPLDTMGLGGLSSAIQKFVGGGSMSIPASFGPGVGTALGMASSAASSGIGKAIRKRLARAIGGGHAHRHMNPGNFKALRRSMRRLKAFEHAAKRVYSFTHRAPGRAKFKFPKRRRR